MKTLSFRIGEISTDAMVSSCQNLHLINDYSGAHLVVTPRVDELRQALAHPLAKADVPGYSSPCKLHGSPQPTERGYVISISSAGVIVASSFIDDAPLCATPSANGFTIMTQSGIVAVEYIDDEWHFTPRLRSDMDLLITCTPAGELSSATVPITLSGVTLSRTNSNIPDAQLRKLSSQLSSAYSELADTAAAAGLWIAPVLVRYHLLSASGERLHSSSPMLLSPGKWYCSDPIDISCSISDDDLSIPAVCIKAQAFRLNVHIPSSVPSSVAAIDICITPQIHPVDFNAVAPYRFSNIDSANPTLTVAMPGSTDFFNPQLLRRAKIIEGITARMDWAEQPYLHISALTPDSVIPLLASSSYSAEAESNTLSRILNRDISSSIPQVQHDLITDISPPNSFFARTVTTNGDTLLWGDITPILSVGLNIYELTDGFVDESWKGAVRVKLRNGDIITRRFSKSSNKPTRFAPLICCCGNNIASIEIFIEDDVGNVSYGRSELQTMPDGKHSFRLFSSLQGDNFAIQDYALPPPTDATHLGSRRQGALVLASVNKPTTITAALISSDSPVIAIHPAVMSQSSWDFARARFYALTLSGIFAVVANTNRSTISASLIHHSGIESAQACVPTPQGLMALSGGCLMRINAARANLVASDIDAVRIGWHAALNHLWMIDSKGNISIYNISTGGWLSYLSPVCPDAVHQFGAEMMIGAFNSIYIPSSSPNDRTPISWCGLISLPPPQKPQLLTVGITADYFSGSITLCGGEGAGQSPILSLSIDGQINAPITARLCSPFRRYISITIEGMVSPDFSLRFISLTYQS